jgi:hypothetical protein
VALDRWQRRALNRALVYDADYRLLHRLYLLSVARQNGKTELVRDLIGWALTFAHGPRWRRLLGLAHDRGQARIPYEAVMEDLEPLQRRYGPASRGGLNVTRYLGIRSGMYGIPREYHVGSREAADQVRSTTNDLGLFDEVLTQRDHRVWAALEPTTTARPEPLIFATSTLGDARSVLLREWWERGVRIIDGAEPMADFGMTVYASSERYPPDDPRSWREANPAVAEGRIPEAAIRSAVGTSGGADSQMFRSERLNLWREAVDEWLPAGLWARQTAAQPLERAGRVVFAVETGPTWERATVTVAWASGDASYTAIAGELSAHRPRPDGLFRTSIAPAEVAELLTTLAEDWRPAAVACIGTSAVFPYVESWADEADVLLVKLGSKDMRAASELFRSELIGGRLWHPDDAVLGVQVRAARPSAPVESGSWYLSQKESLGAVDAIRAAAWAAWAAIAPAEAGIPPQIFV